MSRRYFRHNADRIPVFLFLSMSALDLSLYLMVDSQLLLIPYILLMLPAKGAVSAFNHHHQHCPTFQYPILNHVLEFLYFLHTGAGSNMWKLQHNLGHHLHYKEPLKDEARWMTKSGRTMGRLEYTAKNTIQVYRHIIRIGKRYPRMLRLGLYHQLLGALLLAIMIYYKPFNAILLFVLPMMLIFVLTVNATYDHHAGLAPKSPFYASRNNLNRWHNLIHGNLGYHTAHHLRPGLHWSKLPAFHESIKDRIPEGLIHDSYFSWRKGV